VRKYPGFGVLGADPRTDPAVVGGRCWTAAAIEQLRDTLRREPDYADVRFNLGQLLIGEGRTSDAAAELDVLLRYHPDDTAARLELAKALAQLGRHAEAVQQFRTVIRQEPNNAEAKARLRSLIEVQP